ncbi:hypothetical protein GUITHDRAFT_151578 [Guillardia theta CCMP2712]|uniref:Essential protein Yae1 N-terminal domain-containing protein n=1 Tax=Guillardia theta (strain CCMP2712) TaxID=905079 RepID=L1JKZ1_GUITC|nr:hypothetical protein GUITHDRAFT_151578 [Guillardia theta CCMP2712]EKX48997.1 hypothetical protein GUITHDRAFT_151578 [Guillardia theta CCMP2712]|eukprot:XP_005835977.1 hypothetical protein GUITHDRAFT_151578 [Guillardia theta CCMP2712]
MYSDLLPVTLGYQDGYKKGYKEGFKTSLGFKSGYEAGIELAKKRALESTYTSPVLPSVATQLVPSPVQPVPTQLVAQAPLYQPRA